MIVAASIALAAVHSPAVDAATVTAEEVAALARRIRVEAKLPRVALVGTLLGLVCGLAAIWPFLDSDGYMANALVGSNRFGPLAFLPGWLLAGLLPLLAFYASRLHFETGRSSTGQIETSLRKIRLIILGSMFASAAAFVFVLTQQYHPNSDSTPWLSLLYVACFSACGVIIGDVRRGLGDFDTEYQRRRRRLVRGFMVELGPAAHAPASRDDIPMANVADAVPWASITPPPLPVAAALPTAEIGEDEHFKDLRLLITLAIATAIFVHGIRLGETLAALPGNQSYWVVPTPAAIPAAGVNPFSGMMALLAQVASLLLIPCGIAWVGWGIVSLNYGPTFRRTLGWLTALTLALAILYALPAWMNGGGDMAYALSISLSRSDFQFGGRLSRAPEIIHCLFIGLLLTRPGIKRLFSRTSEIDDPNRP